MNNKTSRKYTKSYNLIELYEIYKNGGIVNTKSLRNMELKQFRYAYEENELKIQLFKSYNKQEYLVLFGEMALNSILTTDYKMLLMMEKEITIEIIYCEDENFDRNIFDLFCEKINKIFFVDIKNFLNIKYKKTNKFTITAEEKKYLSGFVKPVNFLARDSKNNCDVLYGFETSPYLQENTGMWLSNGNFYGLDSSKFEFITYESKEFWSLKELLNLEVKG